MTKYNELCEKNVDESRKACQRIIKQVFRSLEDTLVTGLYAAPGGYKMFCQDLHTMTDAYRRAEGRGVKVWYRLLPIGNSTSELIPGKSSTEANPV